MLRAGFGSMVSGLFGSILQLQGIILGLGARLKDELITAAKTAYGIGVRGAAAWAIQKASNIKHLVAAGLGSMVANPFGFFLQLGMTILQGGATLTVELMLTLQRILEIGATQAGPWVKQIAITAGECVSQRACIVIQHTVALITQLKVMLDIGAALARAFVIQKVHNLAQWAGARLGSMVGALFGSVSGLTGATFRRVVAFTFRLIRRFHMSLIFGATGPGAWVIKTSREVRELLLNVL